MKYRLIRDVTKNECHWLKNDFKKGDIVYSFSGATYGCCSRDGAAVTLEKDSTPFFELPKDSLEIIEE